MANDQTWPTEEKMAGVATQEDPEEGMEDVPDAKKGTTPKQVKCIPKGMSEYQAVWVTNETNEEEGNEEEDNAVEEEEEMVPIDEAMELESEKKSVVAFQDLDAEKEVSQLQEKTSRMHTKRHILMPPSPDYQEL
ncbi:hypothetical protein JVT61DRAFT_10375 [Boletus reticuloceps]|uniref:Uncharacterized protein n=1 Tax=Boletus reticuloceps TaxID=495285 RepID=A0A8I2YY20_9AGAM|nr:hypothetical protein JVT61DRAFT_10375 [Boletus reticuloceps]